MAKFVFELEAVLKQRRAIERERRVALAEVERARIALEDRLRAMHERGVEERAELGAQLGGRLAGGGVIDLRGVRFQTTAAQGVRADRFTKAARYLNAMDERARNRIMSEFAKGDPKMAVELLDAVRRQGEFASANSR